ncbi:hypothetical protein G7085_19205 [Tessaracoccus sp. HDW20]|nr:hypothetical protein [Tessaracoccus coleopterorum]NHB85953.1 hypothetical protein [Tessaracoccus coleopterorum]
MYGASATYRRSGTEFVALSGVDLTVEPGRRSASSEAPGRGRRRLPG